MEESTRDVNRPGEGHVESGLSTDPSPSLPGYVWKSAYGGLAAMAVTIPLGIEFFLYRGFSPS